MDNVAFDSYGSGKLAELSTPVTLTPTAQVITTRNCSLEYLAFANADTSDATVTVKSGSGKTLLPGITVSAGTTETVNIPTGGLFMPSGFTLKSSSTSLIDAWFRYRLMP